MRDTTQIPDASSALLRLLVALMRSDPDVQRAGCQTFSSLPVSESMAPRSDDLAAILHKHTPGMEPTQNLRQRLSYRKLCCHGDKVSADESKNIKLSGIIK